MREAHPIEQAVGIDHYVSNAPGTGGRLRVVPEDFQVREIETIDPEPVDVAPGAYPHLLLRVTLRGWDTNDFVARLSDALEISRERVSWAGTKDKHAVTTQLFSVRGVDAEAVPTVKNAEIEVVGRFGRALGFGDLAGNEFRVRVRDVEAPDRADAITAALQAFAGGESETTTHRDGSSTDELDGVSADGCSTTRVAVPNYFGHQRFGSRRPITHAVGLHVVRGAWREAVLSYVGNPFEAEPEETRTAREFVDQEAASEAPDWQAALDRMPGYLRYERAMLHRLVEAGSEDEDVFKRALEAVPTNLQRLFVNAAQSFVFNQILSRRLAAGLPFHRPVAGDVVCFADRQSPPGLTRPDPDRIQRVTDRRVEVVTRHCQRGRAFVTAPLVGTDTELGEGEPGALERSVLDDLDLDPADFDLPGEFHSTGTRRAVAVRTDVRVERDPLTFEFALPSGAYATVLLREYLKTSPLDL